MIGVRASARSWQTSLGSVLHSLERPAACDVVTA